MQLFKRLCFWGLLLELVLCWGVGPQAIAGEPSDPPDDGRFAFRVDTPALRLHAHPDGYHDVKIEGFETRSRRLGAPDLPTKTVLIAIPPDAVPRLTVRAVGDPRYLDVLPRPVARRYSNGRTALPDRGLYEGSGPHPRRPAWLGETGILRNQRYVEVHVAPVRLDPDRGGLLVQPALELTVHFDGYEAAGATAAKPERHFEPVYRDAFVNYDQGRRFRLPVPEAPPVSPSLKAAQSGPRQRILVHEHGLVRLDHTRMSATGFTAHDLSLWKLSNRGVQVPLEIHDADSNGLLDPGDWVQFYGQALDDEPETELNYDLPGTPFDLFEARDFTDVNPYFLTVDTVAQPAMPQRDSTPNQGRTPPDWFDDTAHEEQDNQYNPLGGADPWYWKDTLVAGAANDDDKRNDAVPLPGLHDPTAPLTLRVHLLGRTESAAIDPDHVARVTLTDSLDQLLVFENTSWDNRTLHLHEMPWTWPGSGPQATDPVRVELEAVVVGGTSNWFVLDYIEIDYRRSFTLESGALFFDWPDGDAAFRVGGLQAPAARVYEITLAGGEQVVQPVLLGGLQYEGVAPPYAVRFRVDNDIDIADGSMRRYLVVEEGAIVVPANEDFEADTVSDLRDPSHDVDLLVIAHPDVLDTGPMSPLTQLLDHRFTAQGGGLTSKVALIQDVADEFNHGIVGPTAIRECLSWVLSGEGWTGKPTHLLLLGDGGYDYKQGTAAGSYVPTQILFKDDPFFGFYASDSLLAAVSGGDQLPELFVGRVPARSTAEAAVMLDKIRLGEQAPAAGSWNKRALFISDRGKYDPTTEDPIAALGESLQFEGVNDAGESHMAVPPWSATKLRYWTDYFVPWINDPVSNPTPKEDMKQAIKDAVNPPGFGLAQYIGHGNFTVWSDDAFFDERIPPRDTEALNNGGEMPFLMAHNCLTGGFHAGEFTMGEDWFKRAGGGAVGVFSPTGTSYNFVGLSVTNTIWGEVFGKRKERLVAPLTLMTRVEMCGQGSIEPCQAYALLGDPAMRLPVHSVEPAGMPQATAGDSLVDLQWTASETAGAVYDVYRTDYLDETPLYQRVGLNETGPAYPGTVQFTDSSAVNATTYWYYVVAKDGEDFESRWSNFNSDCGSTDLDCVEALPLNPDPPAAPTGLVLTDPGDGQQLVLDWAANPADDEVDFYTVYYGESSGSYGHVEQIGNVTRYTLQDLVEGQIYYVALKATNTSGLTSLDYSDEVSDFPVRSFGLRVPDFIDDLTVERSGSDLLLQWGEVTTDLYGKPDDIQLYEIFRGSGGGFTHDALVKIDECLSPCSSYLDGGAFDAAEEYHYRVRAVDLDGYAGGLGAELPRDTELEVYLSEITPGAILLMWNPVDTTFDDRPADVAHYEVYASDAPISRELLPGSAPEPPTIVGGTQLEILPPAQNRYYSVLAVDTRGNRSPF